MKGKFAQKGSRVVYKFVYACTVSLAHELSIMMSRTCRFAQMRTEMLDEIECEFM